MTGTPDDTGYPGDASGHTNPELEQFLGSFQTPEGQAWAQQNIAPVQQYLTARAIGKQAQDASDQIVTNLHDTKTALAGMAGDDPGATDLALGLAKSAVEAVTGPHQLPQEHVDALTSDLHSSIVNAGASRLAEVDRGAAHNYLDQYGDYLPEGGVQKLQNYAMTQEALRAEDARAGALQNLRNEAQGSVDAGAKWLQSLRSDNGGINFP